MRYQESRLPFHRRIGMREEGYAEDRLAEQLENRVFVIDDPLVFVVNDALCLDLPQRRLTRVVLAGFACGVDAALEHGDIAFGAVGTRRGEAGFLRRL